MEDVTEDDTDESSGAMRLWTYGGIEAARQAEALLEQLGAEAPALSMRLP